MNLQVICNWTRSKASSRENARAFSSPTEAAETVSRPRLEARRVSLLRFLTRDWQHAGFLGRKLRRRIDVRPEKLFLALDFRASQNIVTHGNTEFNCKTHTKREG